MEENGEENKSSYRCSPVVRAVVRQKQKDWTVVLPQLRDNIVGFLETDQDGNLKVGIQSARPFVVYGEAIQPNLSQVYANDYFLHQLTAFYTTSGDIQSAFQLSETRSTLLEEFLRSKPDSAKIKASLAISYSKLGSTHSSIGNLPKALELFETETELSEELHAAYPDNVGFKNGLAISYAKLAQTATSKEEKISWFQKAEVLWSELAKSFPDYVQFQQYLDMVREDLRGLDQDYS